MPADAAGLSDATKFSDAAGPADAAGSTEAAGLADGPELADGGGDDGGDAGVPESALGDEASSSADP
jgi:hypothetical protein